MFSDLRVKSTKYGPMTADRTGAMHAAALLPSCSSRYREPISRMLVLEANKSSSIVCSRLPSAPFDLVQELALQDSGIRIAVLILTVHEGFLRLTGDAVVCVRAPENRKTATRFEHASCSIACVNSRERRRRVFQLQHLR